MKKSEFIKKFLSLGENDRAEIKSAWEDIYKGAIFRESLQEAEKMLLWIREAENG